MKWKLLDACPFFILACEKKERALFFSNKLGILLDLGPEWEHNYVTQTTQNQREGEKCKKHYNKTKKNTISQYKLKMDILKIYHHCLVSFTLS